MASTAPDLAQLRRDYELKTLDESHVDREPLKQFGVWMVEAIHAQVPEPTAMTLATADAKGRPSARIVLLKGVDPRGFVFFTNYDSRKGRDLAAHPFAALLAFWEPMHRQIRIEGAVEKIAPADSDAYFASRPRGSQIGAIASPQSRPIASRADLEALVAHAERATGGSAPPRPAHWGGYRVVPEMIELWQGQPSRLHDRVRYVRSADGWQRDRLAP